MATVTLISWNIEHLGPSKYINSTTGVINPNANAILYTIARTVATRGANMLALLELSPGTAHDLIASLTALLGWEAGGNWRSHFVPSDRTDVYCVLYRTGQGFRLLNPGGVVVAACTNLDAQGNTLLFPAPKTRGRGRSPAYFAFTTTDRAPHAPELIFTLVSYHAMFGNFASVGLRNVTRLGPVTTLNLNGVATPVEASFVSGDFNVDLILNPGAYASAYELGSVAVLPTQRAAALSTLKNNSDAWPSTLDYRRNAYDNVFVRNRILTAGQVVDVLADFKVGGALADCTRCLDTSHLTNGHKITSCPPDNNEDAWHFYRTAISNHLPVIATAVI